MQKPPPHPVDRHVGAKLRLRRQLAKVSQTILGQALDLSFQQIQKYETAANRISASMLHAMARELQVTPAWFFEGLAPTDLVGHAPEPPGQAALRALASCPEGMDIAQLMARLSPRRRRSVLALLGALARTQP